MKRNRPPSLLTSPQKIKNLPRIMLYVCCLGTAPFAYADVQVQSGAYYKTWTDLKISNYQLKRSYHSRSVEVGILGVGWCFEFERKLIFVSKKTIVKSDCFNQRYETFTRSSLNTYVNATRDEVLLVKDNKYEIKKGLQIVEAYSSDGHLLELSTSHRQRMRIHYSSGKPTKIEFDRNFFLKLDVAPKDGDVLTVVAPGKAALVYKSIDRNLIQFKDGAKNTEEYHYDSYHNLTGIRKNKKSLVNIKYETEWDRVIEQKDFRNCIYTYQYKKVDSNEFETQRQRQCPKEVPSLTRYTFYSELASSGSRRLTQVRIRAAGSDLLFKVDSTGQWKQVPLRIADQSSKGN